MSRMVRWAAFVVALIVLAVVIVWWVTGPTKTTTKYHPVGVALLAAQSPVPQVAVPLTGEQEKVCKQYPKPCIRENREKYAVQSSSSPTSRATTCSTQTFAMKGTSTGSNKLIADIVHGTAVFHACISAANPTQFGDTWYSWDKHSSWGWTFQGMTVENDHTGWCAECMGSYHNWRLQFEWFHGFNVFGQEIGWHYTNHLACTVRTTTYPYGRWTCG